MKSSPMSRKGNRFHGQSFLIGLTVTVFVGWALIHLTHPFSPRGSAAADECLVPDSLEAITTSGSALTTGPSWAERTEACVGEASENANEAIVAGVKLVQEGFSADPIYPLSKFVKNGLTKFKEAVNEDENCMVAVLNYLIIRAYTIASDEDKKVDFTWSKLMETITQFENANAALADNAKFQLWAGIVAEMNDQDGVDRIKKALTLQPSLKSDYNVRSNSVFGDEATDIPFRKFLVQIWAYMEFMPFIVTSSKETDIRRVEGAKTYREVIPIWVFTVIQRAYGNTYQEKRMPVTKDKQTDDVLARFIVHRITKEIGAQPHKAQGISLVRTYDETQRLEAVQPESGATHAATMLVTGYPNAAYCPLTVAGQPHFMQERQFLIWPIGGPLPSFDHPQAPQTFCTTLTSYIKKY